MIRRLIGTIIVSTILASSATMCSESERVIKDPKNICKLEGKENNF